MRERVLDILGALEGTNKSAGIHGYLDAYEEFLWPLRDERFTLVEIGVFRGASLRMWRSYFKNAQIVGVDVIPDCKQYEEPRITIEIGSQDDPEFMDRVMHQHHPLIVIDDGSHDADHVVSTFERTFPILEAGGLYIVEDAYMHYGSDSKHHRGTGQVNFKKYFRALAEGNAGNLLTSTRNFGITKYLHGQIDFIGYTKGAVIIRKRRRALSADEAIAAAEALAESMGNAGGWSGVADVIMARGGSLQRAERFIRRAIEIDGSIPDYHYRLADVLERQNRLEEAGAVLRPIVTADSRWDLGARASAWFRLGRINMRLGNHTDAVSSFQKAVEMGAANPHNHHALAEAFDAVGRLDEAIKSTERAVELAQGGNLQGRFRASLERLTQKRAASS